MGYIIILVVLFGLMWLLLIRPQRRRQRRADRDAGPAPRRRRDPDRRRHPRDRSAAIEDDVVQVEIAPGTIVRLDRRAVAAVVSRGRETEAEPE